VDYLFIIYALFDEENEQDIDRLGEISYVELLKSQNGWELT